MANNTTLNPGTGGDVIADEDISGVKYQRNKLVDGTVGSTTVIPATTAEPASTAAGLVVRPITDDYVVSGTLAAAAATVTATLYGHNTVAFDVRGTFTSGTSTLAFEATIDGTNWFTIPFKDIQDESSVTGSVASVTIPASTVMEKWAVVTGYAGFRIRMVARGGTDSATVVIRANHTPRPDLAMISMVPGLGSDPSVFSTRLITQPFFSSWSARSSGAATGSGRGVEVQRHSEAGRSVRTLSLSETPATTEGLRTTSRSVAGATATTGTSWTITSTKTLRIISFTVSMRHTAVNWYQAYLRWSDTGAVTTSSPILDSMSVQNQATQGAGSMTTTYPEGLDLSGSQQFGITTIGGVAAGTGTVVVQMFEF